MYQPFYPNLPAQSVQESLRQLAEVQRQQQQFMAAYSLHLQTLAANQPIHNQWPTPQYTHQLPQQTPAVESPPAMPNLKIPVQPDFAELQRNINAIVIPKLTEVIQAQEPAQSSVGSKPRDQSTASFLREKLLAACIANELPTEKTDSDMTEELDESPPVSERVKPEPTPVVQPKQPAR